MKKAAVLSMLGSLVIISSCQKQDSGAEQQLAQQKSELQAREAALDNRMNALDHKLNVLAEKLKAIAAREPATTDTQVLPSDPEPQDVLRDAAQLKALMSDPSLLNAGRIDKDRLSRERHGRVQSSQQNLWNQKLRQSQQSQKTWMSGAPLPSAAATSPDLSSQAETASPTPSPAVQGSSPTDSLQPQ